MGSHIHEGVYGDHSTDGWLEWGLNAHFAQSRAKEGYTPASNELALVPDWLVHGEVERANMLVQKAGLLAAAEARIRYGIQINGWESEDAEREFRRFYDRQAQDYAAAEAAEEAWAQGLEIEGFEWPNVEAA